LVAALEEISAHRMAAYRGLLDRTGTIAEFVDAARAIGDVLDRLRHFRP
jgi:hypothetical protein